MRRDKTRKDLNENVTLELPALSIIASSWVGKDMHGDVVQDKMGGWDESVMMVSSNQKKKDSRDLPTVGVRIIKLKREPPWRGRRWCPGPQARSSGRRLQA